MKVLFSYLLIGLLLLQTFSRELLVVDYVLNQATITARYCVNMTRPQLHCNGKCHLAKQLKKQENQENKAANPLKERLKMLPCSFRSLVVLVPVRWASAPVSYGPYRIGWVPTAASQDIFHPPQA